MLGKRLGKGSFGEVFSGCEVATDIQVAIKVEPLKSPHPALQGESKALKELSGLEGVPHLYWNGSDAEGHYLVMDLLGVNLERLQKTCKGRFTLKTAVGIGRQLISRLEAIHARGYVHKDIKPANCAMGLSNSKVFYLFDFGLSKKYLDLKTRTHMAYHEGKGLIGTARFDSVNAHMGVEQIRRDDLESGLYMLLYMIEGKLPWQGIPSQGQLDKSQKIAEMKMGLRLGKHLPEELQQMLTYIRRLKFEEKPDYSYLHHLLHTIALHNSIPAAPSFDWEHHRSRANSALSTPKSQKSHLSPTPSLHKAEDCSSMQPFTPIDHQETLPRRWPRLSPAARLAIKQSQSPPRLPIDRACCLF